MDNIAKGSLRRLLKFLWLFAAPKFPRKFGLHFPAVPRNDRMFVLDRWLPNSIPNFSRNYFLHL
jgi:hypothetical protein